MPTAKLCKAFHIRAAPFGGKSTIGIGTETSKTIERDKFGLRLKPGPNALECSLYLARQMSSIVECCREGKGGPNALDFSFE